MYLFRSYFLLPANAILIDVTAWLGLRARAMTV